MENIIFGNLESEGIEVVARSNKLYVRYDAGAHQTALREDEISESEFRKIKQGGVVQEQAMFDIQKRLEKSGIKPYVQNWKPNSNT